MLQSLSIHHYALISELEISFPGGFSAITGETGAGKSIIIGALNLILGQRADSHSIQKNKDKCIIEGVFDISSYQLQTLFEERGLEYDPAFCILRREIWKAGKSRAFINDTPVTLTDLKEVGSRLVDIHSQHQNLLLGDDRFQLEVLDALAGCPELQKEYTIYYKEYIALSKQLAELREDMFQRKQEEDYLRFQFSQLEEARLKQGEVIPLEEEADILSNMEDIKGALFQAEQTLNSEENNVLLNLRNTGGKLRSIASSFPLAEEYAKRIESAYIDLKDISNELDAYQEKLELNPERLQEIKDRLDLIYSLQQKHRVDSVDELIALRDQLDASLQQIDSSEETVKELEKKVSRQYDALYKCSLALSERRKKAATVLEKELVKQIQTLGLPHMQFKVQFISKEKPDASGIDQVNYLFSANKHEELKPVSQVASGGEIARLMLGIKSLIAGATALPTIIFDEIDTGISGDIADRMGKIMHGMGSVMQVIAITHLPQIAARGDSQYFVYKEVSEDHTETQIRRLSNEERVREIAQMLSGSELTEAALRNAAELLKQ